MKGSNKLSASASAKPIGTGLSSKRFNSLRGGQGLEVSSRSKKRPWDEQETLGINAEGKVLDAAEQKRLTDEAAAAKANADEEALNLNTDRIHKRR